jgi:hypothetical protein
MASQVSNSHLKISSLPLISNVPLPKHVSTPTTMYMNYNPHFLLLQDYFPAVAISLKLRSYICMSHNSKTAGDMEGGKEGQREGRGCIIRD